jgi:hypothetical protein
MSQDSMKRSQVIAATVIALLAFTAGAQALFFGNVCVVSGTIQSHGKPADKGLPLAAYIGEERIYESQTLDNGVFELRIPEYDPSKPDVRGYRSTTDVVQVKLDGKAAKPTFSPSSDHLKIDFRVESTLDVKLSTWGKIKALFK